MRSHSRLITLLAKEWRELLASRAYWFLLVMIGPLVGHGFITAVNSYAEASGIGGGPAALAQGLSPLDGILVPAFGAYDLVVILLFPFVAIRMVAAEKESGASKLCVQFPAGLKMAMAAKGLALVGGWLIAWIPGLLALILWKFYGGHLYRPETANLFAGHLVHMMLGAGVAVAAAALTESASSAAIIALGFTLGSWAIDFIAAARGGFLQDVAAYTPAAALRVFEHGLLSLRVVAVVLVLSLAGFWLAAVWLDTGRRLGNRLLTTIVIAVAVALIAGTAARIRSSWDLSEDRRNSFSQADETALRQIREPLGVTVYLSAEDPRLTDLDRSILSKLDRILPSVKVDYPISSRSGLFEGAGDHYGEVWYEMAGRKTMSRSTTEPIVLELIYDLAGVSAPDRPQEDGYPGYPVAAKPKLAAWVFYLSWPLAAISAWLLIRRRWS